MGSVIQSFPCALCHPPHKHTPSPILPPHTCTQASTPTPNCRSPPERRVRRSASGLNRLREPERSAGPELWSCGVARECEHQGVSLFLGLASWLRQGAQSCGNLEPLAVGPLPSGGITSLSTPTLVSEASWGLSLPVTSSSSECQGDVPGCLERGSL